MITNFSFKKKKFESDKKILVTSLKKNENGDTS